MSALSESSGALLGLLDAIDDGKLRQVIRVVESSGQRQVLEPALSALRPRLRQLRPQRPLTVTRLLTIPFETALAAEADGTWSCAVARSRLSLWQGEMLAGLPAAAIAEAKTAIHGHAPDDLAVSLTVGRKLWPQAATALAAAKRPGEAAMVAMERLRVADLLAIGGQLVPLVRQLPRGLVAIDAVDEAILKRLLALAEGGPADRLGVLVTLLLRSADQPLVIANLLPRLAPASLLSAIGPFIERVLTELRISLDKVVASHDAPAARPIAEVADDLWRVAQALNPPEGSAGNPTLQAFRQQAAAVARDRYAEAIEALVTADSASPQGADKPQKRPRSRASVRVREATARKLAKLGRAARMLAADTPISRLTEAAVERLVDLEAARGRAEGPLVSVDDARLIEILAGPDLAWRYLRGSARRR